MAVAKKQVAVWGLRQNVLVTSYLSTVPVILCQCESTFALCTQSKLYWCLGKIHWACLVALLCLIDITCLVPNNDS